MNIGTMTSPSFDCVPDQHELPGAETWAGLSLSGRSSATPGTRQSLEKTPLESRLTPGRVAHITSVAPFASLIRKTKRLGSGGLTESISLAKAHQVSEAKADLDQKSLKEIPRPLWTDGRLREMNVCGK